MRLTPGLSGRRGWATGVILLAPLAWAATQNGNFASQDAPVDVVSGSGAPGLALPVGVATIGGGDAEMVGPMVTTSTGSFEGNAPDANGVRSFKGMPYAAPPVGPLRWRPPQPAQPAVGITPAQQFGSACLSAPGPDPDPTDLKIAQSEDCLTVNVWTSATTTRAAKPVMVWIHGGGFQFSSSAAPPVDGALLASHDVIVVSLNYRLGIFGFLATPQFDQESGSSGNWGLQDQIAALRWVQRNIRQFGGDPRNVTLFGESAGAHSVGMLMTSAKAHGLFSKAIIESGATWDTEHGSISTHAEALAKGNRVLARFPAQDLRLLPAEVVRAAGPWDYLDDPTITAFTPNLDGDVLTDTPMNAFSNGTSADIPILGGWNAAEWFPFPARALPAAPAQLFYTAAGNLFGQRCLGQFRTLYPSSDPSNAQSASFQLDGDMGIAEQTWEALWHQGRSNRAWAYRFTYTSSYSPLAYHTTEVPFVFGTLTPQALAPAATPSAADRRMSDTMIAYWTNFAHRGDPNGPGLPSWPMLGADGSHVMQLDTSPVAVTNPDLQRFRFLANYRVNGRLPAEWRGLGSPYLSQYVGPACPP